MALILHLETATVVCSVALSENGKLLKEITLKNDKYAHGEQLTVLISQVLKESNKTINELQAVSVSMGPGSYTGLRIGLSTAKGLCYALNIPIIGIPSLDALIELGRVQYPESTLCPVFDARRMEVYSQIVSTEGDVLKGLSSDIIDTYSYTEFEPFVVFGDGAEKLKPLWNERNLYFDLEIQCSAIGQVKLAHSKYCNQEFEDLAYSEPIYLKDFGGNPLN